MNSRPLVSVVMAARNAAPYVAASLESILGQSLTDLECIVIDDGSTDRTREILELHAARDRRVRVVSQAGAGLPASLNTGCTLARGRYLARMDADDISLPHRLEKQAAFLEVRPEIGICGSWSRTFGTFPWRRIRPCCDDARIRCEMLFNNPLSHPTVMMRREFFETLGGYDTSVVYGEDYALWAKGVSLARFANIPQTLLYYRRHPKQMGSTSARETQERETKAIHAIMLGHLGLDPRPEELDVHLRVSQCQGYFTSSPQTLEFLDRAEQWLRRLKVANTQYRVFSEPFFRQTLAHYWFLVCRCCPGLGHTAQKIHEQSDLAAGKTLNWLQQWSFALDCLAGQRIFPNIPYKILMRLLAGRLGSTEL